MNRLFLVIALLFAISCKEKAPEPLEDTETCYEKMLGTYIVNEGTPDEHLVKIERYDTNSNEVYFKISNLNQMFGMLEKQYCKFPSYGLVFGVNDSNDYDVDTNGYRYYVFTYKSRFDEQEQVLHLNYQVVNTKFYIEDGAPYLDTTITQDLYKR